MTRTVANAVVDLVATAGVRHAYTVPGESFLALLQSLSDDPRVELISTRHESGASFMAEAEAKLTGVPALAMASRGPGAANLAIGVHTAMQDQTPMVVLLGQVESAELGREAFQEVDLAAFYAPICKWSAEAERAADVPALVAHALHRATSGRPGPTVVSVPADFWAQPYDRELPRPAPARPVDIDAVRQAAAQLAELLGGARQPIAIAGPGLRVGRAELSRVADRFDLGVYTAFRRQDCFAADDPHFLGHLGLGVPAAITAALDDADVIALLGTRLDAITSQDYRYPKPDQQLVLIGRDLPAPDHPGPTTVINHDTRAVLAALADVDAKVPERDWRTSHDAAVAYTEPGDTTVSVGVHPADVVTTLRRLAPADAIITNDAGNFSAFAHRYWPYTTDYRQLGPCNGAMGYAVPAAVAAKLTHPERTVLAMVGDGGVLMTGQELETAVRLEAPIIIVVYRNGSYGTIAMHQAVAHRQLAAVDIGEVDLAAWARALGADGATLDRPDDVESVLAAALAADRPYVIDVRTDPDVIAPERSLSQLLSAP